VDNDKSFFYFDADQAEKYLRNVQKFEHVIGNWPTKNIVYEPWQCFVWMNIIGFKNTATGFRRFRIAHVEIARGNAKALCLETDVPTPDRGLVKFGELKIGDRLYGPDGDICKITGRNETHTPRSFRLYFSDGTTVDCSDQHLWTTSSKKERRWSRRKGVEKSSVKTTLEIFNTLKVGTESNHSIENAKPIKGTREDCQLAYVLGYWLGDGNSRSGRFTAHEDQYEEIVARFKSRKLPVVEENRKGKAVTFVVPALTYWLRELDLVNNKHIPEKYFTADEATRRELLRGLMDSDGTVCPQAGNFSFCNTNERLAKQTRRLISSLGYKSTFRKSKTSCQGGYSGSAYYVTFSSPTTRPAIFGIRAKEDRRSNRPIYYANKRYIVDAEEIPPKPMFCIEVDSPSKNFLITDQYIPTHNSAMASQAALYFLALDNPNGNQISTVATKKDQARIVLDSSRAMARKSKSYLKHTGVKVLAHTIAHPKSNSVIRAMSSDHSGLDGLNDILAILDELHAMKRDVFEVIYSGMSKRQDSLTLCITTAGQDVHSVGFSQSTYAKKVALGEVDDDQFFSAVYTLDENDRWDNEKVWIKANPGLGVSVDIDTLRAKVEKAKVTPADIPNIKIKHMNQWIAEARSFFDQAAWDKCADPTLKIEDFYGKEGRLGLDLASHIDIASIGIVFKKGDIWYLFDKSYLPEETIKSVRNTLYDDSVAKGHLICTKGAAINYDFIQDELLLLAKNIRVKECLYDAWNATETAQKLSSKIEMVKVAMNVANFSEPMKKLDAAIRKGQVRHNGSPLLRWCLGNIVAKEDHNGNVFPRKSHEKLKIDPIVAILMALAGWLQDSEGDSVYESQGIRTL
jgi:phage terminase large subunit-like protein